MRIDPIRRRPECDLQRPHVNLVSVIRWTGKYISLRENCMHTGTYLGGGGAPAPALGGEEIVLIFNVKICRILTTFENVHLKSTPEHALPFSLSDF